MTMVFGGRVALVTGAGSGIGRASATLFASRGARVVVAELDAEKGAETVEIIRQSGGEARFVHADAADEASVREMVAFAVAAYGRLDAAHNHVGHPGPQGDVTEISLADFEHCHRLNTISCFLGMKYEIPRMLEAGGGAIVNTGSLASLIGTPGMGAYVSAKHGVAGLTKTTALDFASRRIRVNALCPGATNTPMMRGALEAIEKTDPDLARRWVEPVGRFGTAEEQAEAVVWLCSDAASFVTGHVFPVDGGHMAGNRASD